MAVSPRRTRATTRTTTTATTRTKMGIEPTATTPKTAHRAVHGGITKKTKAKTSTKTRADLLELGGGLGLSNSNSGSDSGESTSKDKVARDDPGDVVQTTTTIATTPNSKPNTKSLVLSVKNAFHRSATPSRPLVGRAHERKLISEFIKANTNLNSDSSGSGSGCRKEHCGAMYISGLPGTGKTVLVNEILDTLDILPIATATSKKMKAVHLYVNCMSHTAKNIFKHLVKELSLTLIMNGEEKETVNRYLTKSGPAFVLILDEIDHLVSKDQDALYSFFELANNPRSRMCLIGIANALDLTTRILPRLHAKNFEPLHISFAPYNVEEICSIIKDRLADSPTCLMQPRAIELTARKLAGTGDLRKALDVCRHAISLVENDQNPQVTVPHILKVTASLLGTSSRTRIQGLQSLPRLVLAIIALFVAAPALKGVPLTDGELYGRYRTVVARQRKAIGCASTSEVQDAIGQLEVCGLVQFVTRKGVKVLVLTDSTDDVFAALKGTPLIDAIIEDGLV